MCCASLQNCDVGGIKRLWLLIFGGTESLVGDRLDSNVGSVSYWNCECSNQPGHSVAQVETRARVWNAQSVTEIIAGTEKTICLVVGVMDSLQAETDQFENCEQVVPLLNIQFVWPLSSFIERYHCE